LAAALECSFYWSPNDPGLTYDELVEVGRRSALQPGEISDAIRVITTQYFGHQRRLLPNKGANPHWHIFTYPQEPEYRNIQAFNFIHKQLDDSRRANGAGRVRLEKSIIVERGVANGIKKLDIEVALAINIFTGFLIEEGGVVRPAHPSTGFNDAGAILASLSNRQPMQRDGLRRAYPIVKDIIERRTDGRPSAAEPLDAFADELAKLGYGAFRLWWTQIVAEMRSGDTQTAAVSVTVLAAALVEGSLAFVVKHAKSLNLGPMGSKTFDGPATGWGIGDLVTSAAAGRDAAILDALTRQRAEGLIRTRQRIHAGRMLSDFPSGPPDLKPEEARDAKATAELVVRKVIEWLQNYPAS
jgi:hypothetical protein